jgi:uncharacterized small protein (DUF1192 family)
LAGSPENAFAEVDKVFTAAGMPDPAKKGDAAPKPEGGKEPPAAPAPPSPKAGEKPPEPTPAKPAGEVQRTPKELRAELERTKGELKTIADAKTALEAKISQYESKGKDTDALRARLDARDKEFEKLQGELRALKQEASPEFKEKYDKPFERAARFAENMLKGITKVDATAADFDKDFVPLYRMPYNAAYGRARELFGEEAAPAVMEQVRELQKLDFARREAFEEEKKGWAEKQKEEEGRIVQQREQFADAWKRVNEDLQNTVAEYKDPADDKELSALRQQGIQIFDAPTKTPRELLWKNAHIRQRTAAYGPNQLTIKRQQATIATLREEIERLKGGQPNPDPKRVAGGAAPPAEKTWEQQMREEMARVV